RSRESGGADVLDRRTACISDMPHPNTSHASRTENRFRREQQTDSVQAEQIVDRSEFRRPTQRRVCDHDGMQRAVKCASPECQKILQDRKIRPRVVLLPDERLQQPRMIRPVIKNMRGSQSKARKLATTAFRDHRSYSMTRRPDPDDCFPPTSDPL